MSQPRNRKDFERGQAVRAAVRDIMAAHAPLAWPLNAKAVNAKLPTDLRRHENTIRWHMTEIRREAASTLSPQQCIG